MPRCVRVAHALVPPENPPRLPMKYLATSSDTSLESFRLSRMNRAANLRKELFDVVEEWIEAEVEARVAERLLERSEKERAGPIDVAPLLDAGAESAGRDKCERCARRRISAVARSEIPRDANLRKIPGAGAVRASRKPSATGDGTGSEHPATPYLLVASPERDRPPAPPSASNSVSRIDQRENLRDLQDVLPHRVLCGNPDADAPSCSGADRNAERHAERNAEGNSDRNAKARRIRFRSSSMLMARIAPTLRPPNAALVAPGDSPHGVVADISAALSSELHLAWRAAQLHIPLTKSRDGPQATSDAANAERVARTIASLLADLTVVRDGAGDGAGDEMGATSMLRIRYGMSTSGFRIVIPTFGACLSSSSTSGRHLLLPCSRLRSAPNDSS